jgi:hypothetical protein
VCDTEGYGGTVKSIMYVFDRVKKRRRGDLNGTGMGGYN